MRLLIALLSLVLPLAARAQLEPELVAEPPAVPYTPITIPLAVRGPYLGTYLEGRQHKNLAKMSPNFWTGTPIGWGGLVRIDGEVWSWMGNLTTE
ncbi:glutaminase GtaA, partial [Pseudohyphozyma bogoriensis]